MRLDVGAALTALALCARPAAAAEEPAEQIAEVSEVSHVEVEAAALAVAPAVRSERVVLLALLRVLEDVVRALDLLEARLGVGVSRVLVRVVLAGELAVRLLELFRRGVVSNAERLVERRHSATITRAGRSDVVTQPVALLQHPDHRARLRLGGLRDQRLVDVRVEEALGLDLDQPLLREHLGQLPVDEANAVLELRLLVVLGGLERAAEVVDHRQELLDEPLVGARDQRLLIARGPLAVVVELRLQALQVVEVLVPLARDLSELVDLDDFLLLCVVDLFRH